MLTSVISKLLLSSKSIEDEQAEKWLQLKVDKNKGHKPSKMYLSEKYNLYFSVNVGEYLWH